jgi:hypothetical protein
MPSSKNMDMNFNSLNVHIIPADEDFSTVRYNNTMELPQTTLVVGTQSMIQQSEANVTTSVTEDCGESNEHKTSLIDLAIDHFTNARQVSCLAAADVLKRESFVVKKRILDLQHHQHQTKRRFQSQKDNQVDNYNEFKTEHCQLSRKRSLDSIDTGRSRPNSDGNNLVCNNQVKNLCETKTDKAIEKEFDREAKSILVQANRMKRLAVLIRSIEDTQRLILNELIECRAVDLIEKKRQVETKNS